MSGSNTCQHPHSTQFADPTPEGIAQNLPAKVLEPLGTFKCLDCGALFDHSEEDNERLIRKQALIATAGLIRADREIAALAVLAPQLVETLKSVRSTLMGLLENKASHTTEGVTGYVHFMRIEIDKALAEAKKAGA